jgi:NAD(P)H-dependent FMN reductase
MRGAAKIVADWARKIPKRTKPWARTQLAVQQKRAQEQLALGLSWFAQQRMHEPNEDNEFQWDAKQYNNNNTNRNTPSVIIP